MLHDTFCTPTTFDMNNSSNNKKSSTDPIDNNDNHDHVNTNSNFATPLQFDTLNSPISPQPRSSNSSLTTSSASSYDESTNVDDQKLVLWIQRQLEFYTTLSILPRFSCIDDIGHGKLLLCLIHRFSPSSVPCLVTTLDQKTSIECLLLADDLAQHLWDTTIDALPVYLYHHRHQHHHQQQQQQQQQSQQDTIGDFVDQLIIPSAFTSRHLDSLPDNIGEESDAQLPAAAALPIWQPLANDVDMNTTSASSLTRCWIGTTYQYIHEHLQHPRTKRLHSLLTLLEQLQQAYVGFTRLATTINNNDVDDLIQSAQKLDNRLERMKEHVITLRGMTATDDGGGGASDDTYLADILIQKHMCLQSWVRSALCLYQQSSKVQIWIQEQKEGMMKHGVDADRMDAVLLYQQENADVKALTEYCRSANSNENKRDTCWVTHVTIGTVIMTLDGLDSLISNTKHASHHDHAWRKRLTQWQAVYTRSLAELDVLDDSVLALVHQAKWHMLSSDEQQQQQQQQQYPQYQQSTSFLQQWKILSRRVAHLGAADGEYGYAAVVSMYQQLESASNGSVSPTTTSKMEAVDHDYGVFIQKWKQLELDLHMSRQTIAQRQRIEDLLHQCHMVQLKATELGEMLDVCVNLYQKSWLEGQVDDLDGDISRVLALANELAPAAGNNDDVANLIQYWKQTLDQCKLDCHQALLRYQSKCIGLERYRQLETIKQTMTAQLDILESTVFDPWTHALDDLDELKHCHSQRKRHLMHKVVARFDQWMKDQGDDANADAVVMMAQGIRAGIEKSQQLLMDYERRLEILEKRLSWEQQWNVATGWIKQMANSVHTLVDHRDSSSNNTSNTNTAASSSLEVIRQQVLGYKDSIAQVQQALDTLLAHGDYPTKPAMVIDRMCQRQRLLGDQADDLDGLLNSADAVLGQTMMVNAYMSTVKEMHHASKDLGARLDDGLLSIGAITDQVAVDQELQALESSAVQLWQHHGSQVPYPLSFLVVDDMVRYKVVAAYGEVLAALVHLMDDLNSWNKRSVWENQWQLDMDQLKQGQQRISMYLQQLDSNNNNSSGSILENEVNDTVGSVHRYIEDQLHHLEELFEDTQQTYPVNIKMPLALENQQQQLTVDVCGHVKSLCGLVTYLQTANLIEDKCGHMNATLDQQGVEASEDVVQQWIDETKLHVEQELFTSLCDQQVQLRDGVDVFGKDKVQLVRDRASTTMRNLQDRLATTLKASQHTRLVQAYEQSAAVLESSLHQLQNGLTSSVDEHGKMTRDDSGAVYQEHEEALHTTWKQAKLALETTHTSSYNDVRCLCQLIQLQQEEPDVATWQSRLDHLWQSVLQDMNDVHRLVLALAQWRDLSSSLDRVETILAPAGDYMDMTDFTITADLETAMNVLPMIYQDAHTTLTALGGMVPSESGVVLNDGHNRAVFLDKVNHLSNKVNSIPTALCQRIQQESDQQQDLIMKRLASLTQTPLFNRPSDTSDVLMVRQWDDLVLKVDQDSSKYDILKKAMDSLAALCDDTGASSFARCQDSVDGLRQAVAMGKRCVDTLLAQAVECGRYASKLFSNMNNLDKELCDFGASLQGMIGSSSEDWRLNLRLLEYRIADFEKNDMLQFITKSQERQVSAVDGDGIADDVVGQLDQHVKQDIQTLGNEVKSQWDKVKAQLADTKQAQLKHLAEQQWQALLAVVDDACDRASDLVAGLENVGSKNGSVVSAGSSSSLDEADDEDETMVHMMGQEQDLVAAEQSMTILDYEMRPLMKSKAVEMKTSLDALVDPWINHLDVDNALDKWEQTLQKLKQRLQHGMTMCQYWAAAAEVHGYLFAMEQVIDKNNPEVLVASSNFMMVDGHAIAVELETKHKVYSDALALSLEKARQVATMVDLNQTDYPYLVIKRNKLEQRYNDRMKEWLHWIGSINGNNINNNSSSSNSSSNSSGSNGSTNSSRLSGLRSRKISLPSKMPSPPLPHASATASTRRRVASSTSSSSSPLLQAQRKIMGRKTSFTNANSLLRPPPPATAAATPTPAPNAYVADPKNDLDMEIGRIVNKVPYKVELQMVPGSAGRYRFGDKVVYCRILKSHMVMVRVGGGWTELSQFLRDHALLVGHGSGFMMQKSSMENCQEAFLETKRATSPTTGRPLPRMSQSTSTSSSISGNAGYKDGDRYIAVDIQGQQHEMKMTPHDSTSSRRR